MYLKKSQHLKFWCSAAAHPSQPLVLFLHGSGERGANAEDVLKWGLPKTVLRSRERCPFHLIAPQCPADVEWTDVALECADLISEWSSKTHRKVSIVAAGFSMGGQGVLEMGARNPLLFDAILAVAPRNSIALQRFGYDKFGSTRILIIHGESDQVVPADDSIVIANQISQNQENVQLDILPGKGHFIADEIFELNRFQSLLIERLL